MDNSSSSSCGGAVVLLSNSFDYVAADSSTALDCRAVGTSGIHWILPGRKVGLNKKKHLLDGLRGKYINRKPYTVDKKRVETFTSNR